MKVNLYFLISGLLLFLVSCDKKEQEKLYSPSPYSSLADFYNRSGAQKTKISFSVPSGFDFTANSGVSIYIPANAFLTQNNTLVTGMALLEIINITTNSDRLLSNIHTGTASGTPAYSFGEFFIRVTQNDSALVLAPGKEILVSHYLSHGSAHTPPPFTRAFAGIKDTNLNTKTWSTAINYGDSVLAGGSHLFQYKLNQFSLPADSGSWRAAFDTSYFSSFSTVNINFQNSDTSGTMQPEVFVVLNYTNCVMKTKVLAPGVFSCGNIPVGTSCTAVAIAVKNGKLYSSFTTFMPSVNQAVNFTVSETNITDFRKSARELDHL